MARERPTRRLRDTADLEAILEDQLQMLKTVGRALRCWPGLGGSPPRDAMRVLLHEARSSKALLGQLGLLSSLQWHDTAVRPSSNPAVFYQQTGLTLMETGPSGLRHKHGLKLLPHSTRRSRTRSRSGGRTSSSMTRAATLLAKRPDPHACQEEGGAHVDAGVTAAYDDLARQNSLDGSRPAANPR